MVHEEGRIWRWPFSGALDDMLRVCGNAILAALRQRVRLLNRQPKHKCLAVQPAGRIAVPESDTIFSDT
jgi:hypothetical protein